MTPKYLWYAPEQLMSNPRVDARTDVYSLAAVIAELIRGRPLFGMGFESEMQMLEACRDGLLPNPLLPKNGHVQGGLIFSHEALERVLKKALSRDPNERFPSAVEFAAALTAVAAVLPVAPGLSELLEARQGLKEAQSSIPVVYLFSRLHAIPTPAALEVAIAACGLLNAMHATGLIHSRVNPHTVCVNREGHVELTNWDD